MVNSPNKKVQSPKRRQMCGCTYAPVFRDPDVSQRRVIAQSIGLEKLRRLNSFAFVISTSNERVLQLSRDGHFSRECTKARSGGGDRRCYNCNEVGHTSRDCPSK
ncbi:zinc knuckle domain-containing protein [Ditylenchus destructor]|uniref:Zinc knuckle domain-containing protein n=1 Tax=Ditylenchus destructor TaxID=166010 RepID=A0AAD4MYC1_9BILA|nr:zinc knuckle domain-containing protein [Ditylenchus destructor]